MDAMLLCTRQTILTAIINSNETHRTNITYRSVFYRAAWCPAGPVRSKLKALPSVEGSVLNSSERKGKKHFQNKPDPSGSTAPLVTCCWLPRLRVWVTAHWLLPVCVVHFDKSCHAQFDDSRDAAVDGGFQKKWKTPKKQNKTAVACTSDHNLTTDTLKSCSAQGKQSLYSTK